MAKVSLMDWISIEGSTKEVIEMLAAITEEQDILLILENKEQEKIDVENGVIMMNDDIEVKPINKGTILGQLIEVHEDAKAIEPID